MRASWRWIALVSYRLDDSCRGVLEIDAFAAEDFQCLSVTEIHARVKRYVRAEGDITSIVDPAVRSPIEHMAAGCRVARPDHAGDRAVLVRLEETHSQAQTVDSWRPWRDIRPCDKPREDSDSRIVKSHVEERAGKGSAPGSGGYVRSQHRGQTLLP